MGLIAAVLGPADQTTLRTLEPEIIKTLRKAASSPASAKRNADNWAFFVDDMHNPVLAAPVTWTAS